MNYEDLVNVNKTLKTIDVKGKQYAEVNQRILAFRKLYPQGTIETEMISNENGMCVFKATASYGDLILGTGHAYEKESSSFINKTSYIENCETSAVGRALGMIGLGVDTSIASAEEVKNAITQQEGMKKLSKKDSDILLKLWCDAGGTEEQLIEHCKVKKLSDITYSQHAKVIQQLKAKDGK